MKNTESAFSPIKQFWYLLLHIAVMEIQLKYFVFFSYTWMIKLLNTSKIKVFFREFQVTIQMYLDIGKDFDDDYDDEYYYE